MRLGAILKNRIVKNASWLVAGRVIQLIISFFVGILTTKYLGPENFGLVNYASAYTAFFLSFCTLGINSVLVKELVDDPEGEGRVLGTTLLLRAVSSILSAVLIVIIVGFVNADEPTTIAVTALTSISLVFNIFDSFKYWFQAKLNSKVVAIVTLVAYIATSAYRIVLLASGASVEWFAFATSVDYIVIALLLLICYFACGGRRLSFSLEYGRRLLSKSYHFILPGLMVAIYGYTDKVMLKNHIGDAEVGYYSNALLLCSMWTFVLSAIIDSVYPSIMEAHKNGNTESYEKNNRRLYAIVFYVSVAASLFFTFAGEFVITLLYGEEFAPAAAPLRIATWYTAFSYLGVARGAWLVCEDKQKYVKYIYLFSALANVGLNVLLIPRFGAVGAAAASLVTQISTIIFPLVIPALRRNTVIMLEAIALRKLK